MVGTGRIIFHYLLLGAFVAGSFSVGSAGLAASARARNVLDTLPRDSSGIISKATLEKHGIASFIGTIQTVTPKERAVVMRAFMISGPRSPQVERTLTFYLTENALINRSGMPTTLRKIKLEKMRRSPCKGLPTAG